MLAWLAAAVSLWLGARRHSSGSARGFRWLAGAAGLYCAGLIIAQVLGPTLSPDSGLSFADLPSLLAVAAAAVGIWTLATADTGRPPGTRPDAARPVRTTAGDRRSPASAQPGSGAASLEGPAAPVLPGLMDGYVMAVALLVIGWVTLFSTEFHRSGERPGTFLLALIHPLADLAVLGALLPLATAAWQRVMLPYLAVCAVLAADALAVGQRALGGAPGVAAQLLALVAALLLAAAPWQVPRPGRAGATPGPGLGGHHRRCRADRGRGHRGGHRQRPGRGPRIRGRPAGGGRRRSAGAGRAGLHAGPRERHDPGDLAGIQPEPAGAGQPDQRRGAGLRSRRRHRLRQPGGRRLRLRPRRAVRAAPAGLRAPRGPGRRARRVPARPRREPGPGPGPAGRPGPAGQHGHDPAGPRPAAGGQAAAGSGRAVPGPGARR